MVGSLLGVVAAKKLTFVKYAYVCDSQRAEVDAFIDAGHPTATPQPPATKTPD
jgi:hypothetical protein